MLDRQSFKRNQEDSRPGEEHAEGVGGEEGGVEGTNLADCRQLPSHANWLRGQIASSFPTTKPKTDHDMLSYDRRAKNKYTRKTTTTTHLYRNVGEGFRPLAVQISALREELVAVHTAERLLEDVLARGSHHLPLHLHHSTTAVTRAREVTVQ